MIDKGLGTQLVFNGFGQGHSGLFQHADFGAEHIYCGNRLPDDYFSSSKAVFVKFKTNEKVAKTGFKLKASTAEGKQKLN